MAVRNIMDIQKNLFKNVVTDYDYARPTYPPELYETIRDFSGVGPNSNILEVGAGTGQATKLFVENNHSLDLLEVSDEQVGFLRGKYAGNQNIRIFKGYFEDYNPDRRYDLIYSATAFHWIKCENGYPKAWEMLRDGGTMAVFWNMFFFLRHIGGVFDDLNHICQKYSTLCAADTLESNKEKRIRQITTGDFFDTPKCFEFRWTGCYDTKKFVSLMNTSAKAWSLSDSERLKYLQEVKECVDAHGGVVEVPELVCLYLTKK